MYSLLIFLIFVVILNRIWVYKTKSDPEYIYKFMKENSNNGVAILVKYNGEILGQCNENKMLPLASVAKIIVAIEFSKQVTERKLIASNLINIKEIEKYFIPNSDGGSYQEWLKTLGDREQVTLLEVAQGMIQYSSNANTSYLMNILGIENTNKLLGELQLKKHENIFPATEALYIPLKLNGYDQNFSNIEYILEKFEKMDSNEYYRESIALNEEWNRNPLSKEHKNQIMNKLNLDFQKIWSNRMPKSTANEYMSILEKLNSKTFFPKDVHNYLDKIMEQLMLNPRNQEWLKHAGQKGGSTLNILNSAFYAEDIRNNKLEVVFFSNCLEEKDVLKRKKLEKSLGSV